MNPYVTGGMIRQLRESKHMTQEELASRLFVSSKAVSKWETGQGLPDITLLEPLARALEISVLELFAGENVVNRNRSSNMLRSVCYVCPVCGNGILALGQAVVSCCGITLPPLKATDAEAPDDDHAMQLEISDGEYYVTMGHPMEKEHYITCMIALSDSTCQVAKLYPEGNAEARFRIPGVRKIFAYCNRHGMYAIEVGRKRK